MTLDVKWYIVLYKILLVPWSFLTAYGGGIWSAIWQWKLYKHQTSSKGNTSLHHIEYHHTTLPTLLTSSMEQNPSLEANWFSASQEIPSILWNPKVLTSFTSSHHLSLSWASSIQFIPPHPTSWRSILILSSHLCLCLPSGFFPSGFPTKAQYTPLLYPICATCPRLPHSSQF